MNVFTPLSNEFYSYGGGQLLLRLRGTTKYVNLGDCESLGISMNIEEIQRYSKEYGVRTLARSDVVQKDGTLNLTLVHMTDLVRGMLYMADPTSYVEQAAITAGSVTFDNVEVGDIYSLGALDVTITSATDGTTTVPVEYSVTDHLKVDRRTGFFEVIGKPDGADAKLTVAFTAPQITATAKRQDLGLMSTNGLRGELVFRSVASVGPQDEITLWDVELKPSGDVELQGGDDYKQVQLTGRILADGTKPAGYQYGRIRSIPRTALA